MPRPRIPFPNYKGRRGFQAHKIPRDDYFDKPALKYPIYNRLPEFWRKEFETKPPAINQEFPNASKRPQEEGLWFINDKGRPERHVPVPMSIRYTEEVHKGLWGGEGYLRGFRYAVGFKYSKGIEGKGFWKEWKPKVMSKKFYSEILEREIKTTVTSRALDLIDAAYGFDNYILKTPVSELCSNFGSALKREMLLRLLSKDLTMYQNDSEEREKVYNRYKQYIVPKEEAEWVGLTLPQAMWKQWNTEKETGARDPAPLLKIYTEQLMEKLKLEEEKHKDPNKADDSIVIFKAPAK